MTITAFDGVNTSTATLTVVVQLPDLNQDGIVTAIDKDTDGDGFADHLELAAGSDPFNTQSTPKGGLAASPASSFSMSIDITLYPRLSGQDKFKIVGTIPILEPSGTVGKKLVLDVGGLARTFELNARGFAFAGSERFTLVPHANLSPFKAQLLNDTASPYLYQNAFLDGNGYPDHVVVTIVYEGLLYRANVPLKFKKISNGGIRAVGTVTAVLMP